MEESQLSPATEGEVRPATRSFLLWLFYAAFVCGGLIAGAMAAPHTISWVTSMTPPALTERILPVEVVAAGSQPAPDWKNLGRVNVLVMGVDRRPDEESDPTRTDTMMLVTLDPSNKQAGVLSIPRDLWVPIPLKPNHPFNDRINTATVYGEMYDYPGGGPGLAKDTVQYNLGVRVNYFVEIDFQGFKRIIDTLGGVDIDVPETIVDNAYPTENYGTMRITIPAGHQHFDGEHALWYVRTRHTIDSDFGRMHRQQQLLQAVRRRMLQLDIIPKLPALWSDFRASVRTDMPVSDLLAFASAAREIPDENIASGSLDGEYVTASTTAEGAAILVPNRARVRELVGRIFNPGGDTPAEARVEVLNGTGAPGLATRTAKMLETQGVKEVSIGDARGGPYQATLIQDFSGKAKTAAQIAEWLDLPSDRVTAMQRPADSDADIRVILGADAP